MTLQLDHITHALGLEDEKEVPPSASTVTLFILICPEPTHERSEPTRVPTGLGHTHPEMCTNSCISSLLCSACVLYNEGYFSSVSLWKTSTAEITDLKKS